LGGNFTAAPRKGVRGLVWEPPKVGSTKRGKKRKKNRRNANEKGGHFGQRLRKA